MFKSILKIFQPLLGWIFGIVILLSSLFGSYIISLFLILIALGKHRTWRSLMDRSVSFWMMVPIGFLELVFGMRVRVSGDEIDYNEPALIIMNHRTRLDWMYMWSALFQMNPWLITSNKISLKAQLQSLPGAGFGMSAAQFLFLHRNKERDATTFDEAIAYYKDMQLNYQLLLFPEGTDKSPWTTLKSTEFAKKNGLKELKHLLYPRVAGFFHLLTKMKEAKFVTYVYDITIAYPYNIVQSEVDLVLKGSYPHEVHFHVKKIPANEVPRNEVDCARWLNERWIQKEATLEEYYGEPKSYNRRFQVEKGQGVWKNVDTDVNKETCKHDCTRMYNFFQSLTSSNIKWHPAMGGSLGWTLLGPSDNSVRRIEVLKLASMQRTMNRETKESPRVAFVKRFCFWFWMLVVTIVYYHITFLLPLQIAAFYFALAFFVIKFIYGSLDRCVMRRWQSSFAES